MSAWAGPSSTPSTVSLSDVMSEQLAVHLTENDQRKDQNSAHQLNDDLVLRNGPFDDDQCASDELLAKMLQKEFDREFDAALKMEERQRNGDSKVSLSFERFRRVQEENSDEDDDGEIEPEFGPECRYWDALEQAERQQVQVGGKGFAVKDGVITTKHDSKANQIRNAHKAMELDVKVGDGINLKLSNSVYNALKNHSVQEGKRLARLHEKKEKSTNEMAIDEKTKLIVFKFVNNGLLDEVNGVIATGKESVVLHALGHDSQNGITNQEMAIKIYKTTLNEFKARDTYVVGDPRFGQVNKLGKQNPRVLIPIWAEKERDNLKRLRNNNIRCPQPVALKKHVLIMTLIGKDARPAPKLKDAKMTEDEYKSAWDESKQLIKMMYKKCDLVHGDLSEYNLLWHEQHVYVIDVSQAVLTTHPHALPFLWRDCFNLCKFFNRFVPDIDSPRELFEWVCGKTLQDNCDESAVNLLAKIANFKITERDNDDGDSFEEMLERSEKERQNQNHDDK